MRLAPTRAELPRIATPAKGADVLSWALTFLIIAMISGVLGFWGIAGLAATIAKLVFLLFLVLFVVALVTGRRVRID